MSEVFSAWRWATTSGKSFSVKSRVAFYFGEAFLLVFSAYLYEQVFYELFLGHITSVNRPYELIVIAFGFAGFCLFMPISMWFPKSRLRTFRREILFCHVIGPACFVMLISFTNLSLCLGIPLYIPSALQKVDAIVVVDKGSFPFRGRYGAELLHRGLANKMVVFVRKAEPNVSFLTELQVPDEAVIWARKRYNNTKIEASTTRFLFRRYGWKSALVVADDFLMFRVMNTFKKTGLHGIYPAPVPPAEWVSSPARLLGWAYRAQWDVPLEKLDFRTRFLFRHKLAMAVFHEYTGSAFYFFKGYI